MGHSPMSRQYSGKQDFTENTLKVLGQRVLMEPLRLRVVDVIVGSEGSGAGDRDGQVTGDAVIELEAIDAICRDGSKYDMRYCWVCKFEGGKIIKVRVASYLFVRNTRFIVYSSD